MLMNMLRRLGFCAWFIIFGLINNVSARDLRNVTEPKTPETCLSVQASGGEDTEAIQIALDSCTEGKAVALSPGTFYSGPLLIPSGVSLLVSHGATLKALADPELYDLGANTCGTLNEYGVGCKAFITMVGAIGSGIYGRGTIDGQGNVTMAGRNISWWDLSKAAQRAGNFQNNPRLVQINNSLDITLYQVTLINSPFYTVASSETNGFTVWGVTILAPASARNTDGIDPIGSQNVTIAHCYISIGDDNVAIKALTAPSRHISVLNNHFDSGNGMCIGSEVNHGASDVTVSGITFNGSKNGVHIKSNTFRGGHVTRISYSNLCMYNVQKPIHMDMEYAHLRGNRTPEFHDISLSNVRVLTKGMFMLHGLSESDPVYVRLKDVHITKDSEWFTSNAVITGTYIDDVGDESCGYTGNN
uniref:Glycoside hydrolase family 28 n=1 Tax=Sipyloidea sipylus TaxID=202427 RepID=A0A191XT52_SIPSI|nr:glycoside hydrolase family 28 [Sipyloidea sipylus]